MKKSERPCRFHKTQVTCIKYKYYKTFLCGQQNISMHIHAVYRMLFCQVSSINTTRILTFLLQLNGIKH